MHRRVNAMSSDDVGTGIENLPPASAPRASSPSRMVVAQSGWFSGLTRTLFDSLRGIAGASSEGSEGTPAVSLKRAMELSPGKVERRDGFSRAVMECRMLAVYSYIRN